MNSALAPMLRATMAFTADGERREVEGNAVGCHGGELIIAAEGRTYGVVLRDSRVVVFSGVVRKHLGRCESVHLTAAS